MRIAEIARNKGLEPFLSCGIPELKSIIFGLIEYIFG